MLKGSLASTSPLNSDSPTLSVEGLRGVLGADGPALRGLGPITSSPTFAEDIAKGERTEKATLADYVGSSFRQDSPVDGAVAHWVGSNMAPDPEFNPWDEKTFQEDAVGVHEQFLHELRPAVSREHRLYLKDRILRKQEDLERLGDLGFGGNVGRFALGFVDPVNAALAVGSGGITSLARVGKALTQGQRVAAGVGSAAAGNYAFERFRQSVNFEDSQTDAIVASLLGTAFAAPFIGLNAREMARVRQAATDELRLADRLRHLEQTGEAPTPEDLALAERIHARGKRDEPGPLPKDEGLPQRPEEMLERETAEVPSEPLEAPPEGWAQGSIGAATKERIPGVSEEETAMSRYRFDIFARLNKDANPEVRALADVLVKDAIQKSDVYAQQRTASEEKRLLQRRLAGNFHFQADQAFEAAAKKLGWGLGKKFDSSNAASFFESAGRLARGEERVLDLGVNRAIEPELRRVASEYRKVMDSMLDEMKRAGVKGAEEVSENPAYVNRIWNVPKMKELMKAVGENNVVRLVASAIRVPGKQGDADMARKFLLAVQRLEHSHLSTDLSLHAYDDKALTRELTKAQLSFDEIDAIKQALFEAKEAKSESPDAGNAPNLKFRFQIDETASMDVNGRTISIADLLENDSRVLMDRYMNSMAGHVALAKKGITSRADFDARIRAATKDHEDNALSRNDGDFKQSLQILDDVYANLIGRPMSVHSFNMGDRVAATLRALARAVYLGQLGFTAANELFHAASLSTFRAAVKHMPSFAEFVQAARKGYVPGDRFAEDLRLMTGFGTENASSYARQHEISEFTYDKKLTWVENASNRLSHVIDKVSGNSFFTSFSRGLASKFMVQKYADFASGKLALDDAWMKRLVGNGIDAGEVKHVLAALNKHVERDASGRVEAIRWEDWSAKDPDTYHSFTTAIQREVRNAIQDHDLGETWYFQHTSIGKIFTELRAFSIAAHSKQMLNGLHYRDHRTMHLWITGFVTQSMAYVAQTAANYAHDEEKRAKMLTPEKIALAAYKRMSVTGLMPLFTEPFLPESLTGLTANTENRMPWITPSMMMTGKVLSGASAAFRSGVYGEAFTGKDVKNILTLPGANTYGARNLVDWMSSMAPKSEHQPAP